MKEASDPNEAFGTMDYRGRVERLAGLGEYDAVVAREEEDGPSSSSSCTRARTHAREQHVRIYAIYIE